MKIKELQDMLSKFDPETECFIYADHGQTTFRANTVNKMLAYKEDVKNKNWAIEDYNGFDVSKDELDDFLDICVIS